MADLHRIYHSPPHMSGREQKYLHDVFEANWIAPVGPHIQEFESRFAKRIGVEHAVAVSSGTAALHLILRHVGLEADDEVICPTFTFCASANPITYDGGKPLFIDSDRISWNLDPNLVADELDECARSGDLPKAIVAVHILGQCADMDSINEIAAKYEIPVIEDTAEALGSDYKEQPAGSHSWASFFSFNGNKIITTSGGGMICTNDAQLAEHARFLSTQARDPAPYYVHSEIGFNYRLSNVLAAIGLGQLDVLEERIAARRHVRDHYRETLQDVEGIAFMTEAPHTRSNGWLTTILVNRERYGRDCEELRQRMEEKNIEARRVWKPLHTQPVFANCRRRGGAVSEELFSEGLCLPSGSAMSEDDLKRVVDVILD